MKIPSPHNLIFLIFFLFSFCDSDEGGAGRCKLIYKSSETGPYKYEVYFTYSPMLTLKDVGSTNGVRTDSASFQYTFDKSGRVIKMQSVEREAIFFEYLYQSNFLIVNQYNGESLLGKTEYEFNVHGQLIKRQDYMSGLPLTENGYAIYEYADNVTMNYSKSYHYKQNASSAEIHEYTYDDKKNVGQSLKPFFSKVCDNNIVKEIITAVDGSQKTIDYYYVYNSQGYPEYANYLDYYGHPHKEVYTYVCD
jgi:hypothetical protein